MTPRVFLALFLLGTLQAAYADGIPTNETVRYAGMVLRSDGTPLSGTVNVVVSLWNVASGGTPGANRKCESANVSVTLDPQGRFSVALPAECTTAISQNADLFVELTVNGAPLSRTKVSATPYAVEAARSTTTSQILTGTVTVTVNPAGGAQFTTFDAAWQWLLGRVIRGKVTLQLADGMYNLTTPLGYYQLEHPDGHNISIIGNAASPQSVVLNGRIRIEGSRLGLLSGVRIQGTGTEAIGLHLLAGASVAASAVQVMNFIVPVQAESNATGTFLGAGVTCAASGSIGFYSVDGAFLFVENSSVNTCPTSFQALNARMRATGCVSNGGAVVAQDGAQMTISSSSASAATALNQSFIRAPNWVGTPTLSPPSITVGNVNSVIVP